MERRGERGVTPVLLGANQPLLSAAIHEMSAECVARCIKQSSLRSKYQCRQSTLNAFYTAVKHNG